MNLKNIEEIYKIAFESKTLEAEIKQLDNLASRLANGELSFNIDINYDDKNTEETKIPKIIDADGKQVNISFLSELIFGYNDPLNISSPKKPLNKMSIFNTFNDSESLIILSVIIKLKRNQLNNINNTIEELQKAE